MRPEFQKALDAARARLAAHDEERHALVAQIKAIEDYAARQAGLYRVLRGAAWTDPRSAILQTHALRAGETIRANAWTRAVLDAGVAAGAVLEPIDDDHNIGGSPPCPQTSPKPATAARRPTAAPSE